MKSVQKISLWMSEGTSDKIYEVELFETGNGKFVVNFRYGRRGTALRDGTKTPLPTERAAADVIYYKLVASKTKEGYAEVGAPAAAAATKAVDDEIIPTSDKQTLEEYVFARLKNSLHPTFKEPEKGEKGKWSFSRIVWRIGELRIREAVPTLISVLTKGDKLQQYINCWALGRCGDTIAAPYLKTLSKAAASSDATKRIAFLSYMTVGDANAKIDAIQTLRKQLPSDVDAALSLSVDDFKTFLLKSTHKPDILYPLYLMSEFVPAIKAGLMAALEVIPYTGSGHFKTVRHIFKAAEFKDDADLLGFLTFRFEMTPASFQQGRYGGRWMYDGKQHVRANEILKKSNSTIAYSNDTRDYFLRRSWRTFEQLAENKDTLNYAIASAAYLVRFTDAHQTAGRQFSQTTTRYTHDQATGRWTPVYTTRSTDYKENSNYILLNHIMHAGSNRYELNGQYNGWKLKEGAVAGAPTTREESYPEIWDKYPDILIRLLCKSRFAAVHQFAIRALRANVNVLKYLTFKQLVELFAVPYPETLSWCMEIAQKWYDPNRPNVELASALLNAALPEARALAISWIEANPKFYLGQPALIASAVLSPHHEIREWITGFLKANPLHPEITKLVIGNCVVKLLSLESNDASNKYVKKVSFAFKTIFALPLKDLEMNVINNMLRSTLSSMQILGAELLANHNTPAEKLPDGIIGSLISSSVPEVRSAGVTLFGKLPTAVLLKSKETLKAFCLSAHPEIRTNIRPTITRLAKENAEFGRQWVDEMLGFFRIQESSEGLHEDILLLFKESLSEHLGHLDTETMFRYIDSSKTVRQAFGQLLLEKVIPHTALTMRQIVRLGNHDLVAVRKTIQKIYEKNVGRIQYESAEGLRILDSKHDDMRNWSFEYFRNTFTEREWTPENLVFVCDSTRLDVQNFGKEMIAKFFKTEEGGRYLLQLSQHPSQNLQQFATNYLESYAADQPETIHKLEQYFITVLSQVNRSGVAKLRVFQFLEAEALKNEAVARMIAQIMSRQSATLAVADKAATLKVMMAIHKKYPHIKMAMQAKAIPVYQKS
jgi:predicted DNA-binding WGR domain protein